MIIPSRSALCLVLTALSALLGSPSPVAGTTIIVDWSGGGDYLTIQEGIDAAAYGDTVLVLPGTYHEHLSLGMPADGIALLADAGPELTIVTNDSLYPNSVVKCEHVGPSTLIQGFTFSAGYTNELGAGIQCYDASPRITGNVISDCRSFQEGGGIGSWDGNVLIEDNLIVRNKATDGGGISITGGETLIQGNVIVDNVASGFGGRMVGGGILIEAGTHTISSNLIHRNHGVNEGGGIAFLYVNSSVLQSNVIAENLSAVGGGIYIEDTPLEAFSNVVTGNQSSVQGAALVRRGAAAELRGLTFEDNIFFGNACPVSGAIVLNTWPPPSFHRNYLVDASKYEVLLTGTSHVDTLDFTGNWWGTSDPDSIEKLIWDCWDNPALQACVDFSGWCVDPSCNGQVTEVPEGDVTSRVSWGRLKAMFKQPNSHSHER